MLSEEEKKAIERMYDLIHACEVGIEKHGQYDDLFEKDKQAIETVLNLITRLEKELKEQTHKKTYARQNAMYKNKQLGQARNKIKKLQKENEDYKKLYQKALSDVVSADKENIELKKQLDLMAEFINKQDIDEDICKNNISDLCDEYGTGINCIKCIKQYFENKVKEDNING